MVNRIQEIRKLFDEMVSLNPDAREKYLLDLGTTVNALRNEVFSLLQAHDQSPSFLERPAIDWIPPDTDETGYAGRMIGAYRVVRQIGKGGMGLVFLAERADGQYQKQVALKLIRQGLDSKESIQRFLAERQTLARMNHPGIARFLEGGLTDSGRPYIIMEFVDGIPIDHYFTENQLPLEIRLQIFQKVAAAVSYLHRNLIVHRDLKPANILITPDGNPVLLDFGIAKLLNPAYDSDGEALTQAGMWLMTPEYASPEQVRSEPITVASDVYSLGVLLYELLTGQRPYQFKNRLPQEIERVICEVEPPRPSLTARTEISENWSRRLQGDLDAVLLKALQKGPTQRYASVQDFSDDLARYLDGKPVTAQRSTALYRTRKYVRRNWRMVSAGSILFLIFVFFGISLIRQSNQVIKERDKAQATTAFIVDLFKEADPEIAQSDTITARELLNVGRQKIETNFRDQLEIKGTLLDVIGQVYQNLGQYAQAESLITQGMRILWSQLPERSPEVLKSRSHFAEIQLQKGNYTAADSLFSLLLEQNEKVFGKQSPEFANALENLGTSKFKLGQIRQSVELCSTALEIKLDLYGRETLPVAEALFNLGHLMVNIQEFQQGRIYLDESYQIRRQILGEKHTLVATTMVLVALCDISLQHYDAAEKTLKQSIAILHESLGPDHPKVIDALSQLGIAIYWNKKFVTLDSIHQVIYNYNLKNLGRDHPRIAPILSNMAGAKQMRGQYAEAIPLYMEAIRNYELNLGKDHPSLFHYRTNLAAAFMHANRLREAEQLFLELLPLRETQIAEFPLRLGPVTAYYGMLLTRLKRYPLAEKYLREGLEMYRKYYKGFSRKLCLADASSVLGEVLTHQRRYAEAETLLVNAQPVLEEGRGKENLLTLNALKRLVALYEAWGKPEKAAFYRNQLSENERASVSANLNSRKQWQYSFK